jgi:hypothetical protein
VAIWRVNRHPSDPTIFGQLRGRRALHRLVLNGPGY